jgi:hypothetical protein
MVTATKVREFRRHPSRAKTGFGWYLLADRSSLDKVYLISQRRKIVLGFDFLESDLSYQEAQNRAKVFAQHHPEVANVRKDTFIYAPTFVGASGNRAPGWEGWQPR